MNHVKPSAVSVVACNSSPYQNWYSFFGQIRNAANGLCLDAPSASSSGNPVITVSVSEI